MSTKQIIRIAQTAAPSAETAQASICESKQCGYLPATRIL